jgi:hypothetical protein
MIACRHSASADGTRAPQPESVDADSLTAFGHDLERELMASAFDVPSKASAGNAAPQSSGACAYVYVL